MRSNLILCLLLALSNLVIHAGNHAAKQTGARNRVWTKGITGDPNSAIAVFDTGIDAGHIAFAPGYLGEGDFNGKIVYWYDNYGDGDGVPDDSHTSLGSGHGTHASGLAAGSGFASIDAQGRLVNTNAYPTQLSGNYAEQTAMVVDKIGTIRIEYTFDSNKGDVTWAKLMFGSKELVNDLSGENRVLLGSLETVVSMDNLTGTPGLAGIDPGEEDQFNWNVMEYQITSPAQFGTYHFVTNRNVFGSGLGADMRFIYVAAWPADVNPDGTDPEDGLPYYMGQAPDTKLFEVQATSSTDFLDSIDAMYSKLATHHVTVVNLSAASSSFQPEDFDPFEQDGMVVLAAAGNSSYNSSIDKPARFDSVVAVGGLTAAETLGWYPNAGPEMDILAPGGSNMTGGGVIAPHNGEGNFPSAWGYDLNPNDGMGMQGTSMATPSAAGVFALVYDALGGWDNYLNNNSWKSDGQTFSKAQKARHVKRLVFMTATELNTKRDTYNIAWDPTDIDPTLERGYDPAGDAVAQNYGKDRHEGYGRINADAAVDAVLTPIQAGDSVSVDLVSSQATWSSTARDANNLYAGTYDLSKAQQAKAFARYLTVDSSELTTTYANGVNFNLDVPAGADFDLYVYRPDFGPNGQPLLLARSVNAGQGSDESLLFQPDSAGTWYVVVKAVSGEGSATLTLGGAPCNCSNQAPVASFIQSVTGLTVSFSDTSSDADGSIAGRSWTFGDGQTSTVANPSVTYSAAGTYAVSLTVTDNEGATATANGQVTVSSSGGGGSGPIPLQDGVGVTGSFDILVILVEFDQWTHDKPIGADNPYLEPLTLTGLDDLYNGTAKQYMNDTSRGFVDTTFHIHPQWYDMGNMTSYAGSAFDPIQLLNNAISAYGSSRQAGWPEEAAFDKTVVAFAGPSWADEWDDEWAGTGWDPDSDFIHPIASLAGDNGKAIVLSAYTGIGTIVHELGHALFNLKDKDPSKRVPGYRYQLIGAGAWNGVDPADPEAYQSEDSLKNSMPALATPWNRVNLGWEENPIHFDSGSATAELVLAPASEYTGAAEQARGLVTIDAGGGHFYILENRQPTGWDLALPSWGILIWEITDSLRSNADADSEFSNGVWENVIDTHPLTTDVPPGYKYTYIDTRTSAFNDFTHSSSGVAYNPRGLYDAPLQPGESYALTGSDVTLTFDGVLSDGSARITLSGVDRTVTDPLPCQDCGPVNQAPVAAFSWSAADLTVSFSNSSSDPDGDPLTYAWDFGDGGSSTAFEPGHTYAAAGDYTVSLTVTDTSGAQDTVATTVTASEPVGNQPPTAAFSWNATDLSVAFTDGSSDPEGGTLTYSWDFGDGNVSAQTKPTHVYGVAGTYTVSLTVTDDQGAGDTASRNVTVSEAAGGGQLQNGVGVTVSGADDTYTYFTIDVPAGQDWLDVITTGGTGDADLYVAFDRQPTRNDYDGKSASSSNEEALGFNAPSAGTWHVLVFAWSDYSDLTLTASYGATPVDGQLVNGVPLSGLGGVQADEMRYTIDIPEGAADLLFTLDGGSGDLDIYVRYGASATRFNYDARSAGYGNSEDVSFSTPQAGVWHVLVYAYRDSSGATLTASYTEPGSGGGGSGGGGGNTYANTTATAIPDGDSTGIDSLIAVNRTGDSGQVQVTVQITHTYIGDLYVALIAPDGSVWVLHDRTGSSADNLDLDLTIDASGIDSSGTWTLHVEDQVSLFSGTLEQWSMTFPE